MHARTEVASDHHLPCAAHHRPTIAKDGQEGRSTQQDSDFGEVDAHTCRRVTDWAGCRWLTTALAPEGQNGHGAGSRSSIGKVLERPLLRRMHPSAQPSSIHRITKT